MDNRAVVEYLKLGDKVSVVYPSFEMFNQSTKERKPVKVEKHFTGEMSGRTRSKIQGIVSNWVNAIDQELKRSKLGNTYRWKYITFVTLTLPSKQIHDDREIKRDCLNPFLTDLKRMLKVKNFLWVAETQANGNIHFHVIADRFIDYIKVRYYWNKAVNRLGYVDRFEKKHGHRNPNSTDIHALRGVRNVAQYVVKYLDKKDDRRKIEGRLWSCTKGLKDIKPYSDVVSGSLSYLIHEAETQKKIRVIQKDYVIIIVGNLKKVLQEKSSYHRNQISRHYQSNFDYLYRDVAPPGPFARSKTSNVIEKVSKIVPKQLKLYDNL